MFIFLWRPDCKNSNVNKITVITGKGTHSLDGCARLRTLTLKKSLQYGVHAEIDPNNEGVVIIYPQEKKHESDEKIVQDFEDDEKIYE